MTAIGGGALHDPPFASGHLIKIYHLEKYRACMLQVLLLCNWNGWFKAAGWLPPRTH